MVVTFSNVPIITSSGHVNMSETSFIFLNFSRRWGRGGYGQLDTLCNNKGNILRNNKILYELFDRLFLTLQLLKELIIVDENCKQARIVNNFILLLHLLNGENCLLKLRWIYNVFGSLIVSIFYWSYWVYKIAQTCLIWTSQRTFRRDGQTAGHLTVEHYKEMIQDGCHYVLIIFQFVLSELIFSTFSLETETQHI